MPWPSAETLLDLSRTIASAAANWWIQSTLLIAAGLVVGTMCRKRGSAVQSVVYRTTLAAVLAAPLVTWGLYGAGFSGWSIAMPAAWSVAETSTIAQVVAIDSTRPVDLSSNGVDVSRATERFELTNQNVPSNPFDDEARIVPSSAGAPDVASETPAPASSSLAAPAPSAPAPSDAAPVFTIHLFGKVAAAASAAWLLAATVLITRIAVAWRRLGQIRRGAAPAEPSVQSACRDLAARLSVDPPTVLRSPYLPSPCLAGLRRPAVLLPETSVEMPVHDVLVHELAHLSRGDCYWNLVRRLASAVLFFQPLMCLLSRRIEATAEEVCDDFVVHLGGDRRNYAYRLCDIAELSLAPFAPAGVGIVSLRSMLAQRVTRIMDTSRSLSTRVGGALLALVLLGGLLGAFAAGLVGLSETASATIAADSDDIDNPGTNREESLITEDQQRSGDDSKVAPKESVEETPVNDSPVEDWEVSTQPLSYSGRVETPQGEPIAGAKIWLAVTSHDENQEGLLRELGTTDEQGRFEVVLDAVTTQEMRKRQEIRRRFNYYQSQLVATAEGRGLDWMPLDVFEDNPAPSAKRDTLQARIDQSLGDGYFASRTLKLRPESRPVRGRLVDLEGHRMPNVTVLVESLRQPDIPRLLKAFEMSWKREMNEAFSATSFGVGGLARSELQKLIPSVTTDEKGEFELRGIADDQLVTLVFDEDRVEARPLYVLGREMETVSLPHIENYPSGSKDVFVGRDFTYAVGPSVPVEGVVTDCDTGEPVANVLVYVERLFKNEGADHVQLRLDTHHMRAVTDRQGRFRITGIPPGEGHVLEVIPRKSEPYLMTSQDVLLSLEDGGAKRIEIQVKRGIWIEGRVTDKQSGEPLSATVGYLALKNNPHALEKSGLDWRWITERYWTDRDGRYRTLGLPGPGVLLVTMHVPGYPKAAGAETIDGYDASGGVIPTIWPQQVSDWHLLKQIEPATDAISSTCDLVLDADVPIPGRVVGPRGKPISDLYVLGQTEGDEWWRPRHTDYIRTTDRFAVYGYDGKGPRQLFFKNQDETLVGQYRLEGDAPEEIVVTLQPSVRATGRLIENETDLPPARYFLSCENCSLFSEKYRPVNFRTHWCFTDDEARFEIKGLMAGFAYKMVARNDGNSAGNDDRFTIDLTAAKPGESKDLGDVRLVDEKEFEAAALKRNEKPAPLSNLNDAKSQTDRGNRYKTIQISGRVLDPNGKPFQGAKLYVPSFRVKDPRTNSDKELVQRAVSDDDGRFEFTASLDNFPEYLDKFQILAYVKGYGVAGANVPIDGDRSVTINLARDRTVRGRILDTEGRPLAGVSLAVVQIDVPEDGELDQFLNGWQQDWQDAMGRTKGALDLSAQENRFCSTTTNDQGEFQLLGVGEERIAWFRVTGAGVAQSLLLVITRDDVDFEGLNRAAFEQTPDIMRQGGGPPTLVGPTVEYIAEPGETLDGTVRDAETGDSISGAVVSSVNGFSNSMSATSDATGRFRLAGLSQGNNLGFGVSPPEGSRYLGFSGAAVNTPGFEPVEIDIELQRGVIVTGKVIDRVTGEPVTCSTESVPLPGNQWFDKPGYDRHAINQSHGTADKDGNFRLVSIPGPVVVMAQARKIGQTLGGRPFSPFRQAEFSAADHEKVPVTVDGQDRFFTKAGGSVEFLDIKNAVKYLELDRESEFEECVLYVDRGQQADVRLLDDQGNPLPGVVVAGLTESWPITYELPDSQCRLFALNDQRPRDVLFFHRKRHLAGSMIVKQGETPPSEYRLQPAKRIIGRAVDSDGQPLHQEQFELWFDNNTASELERFLKQSREPLTTDEEGRFEIGEIVPGYWFQMACGLDNSKLISPRIENRPEDFAEGVLDLGDVTMRPRMELTAAKQEKKSSPAKPTDGVHSVHGQVSLPDG